MIPYSYANFYDDKVLLLPSINTLKPCSPLREGSLKLTVACSTQLLIRCIENA